MRVMVAMSGGVDSSVAAGLMVEAGHEVIGLTMKLRDSTPEEQSGMRGSCCSPDDLMDARVVCDHLGIPHYIVDYRDLFREKVIEPFAESYLKGETPNPCVSCNDHVKFEPLLERAKALEAELLVTGHYAQIIEYQGRKSLYRGKDPSKDQSYFLYGISQEALNMSHFPLGSLTKDEVRAHAQRLDLPNWDKADSEDICFVPHGDYAKVVEEVVGEERTPSSGPILNSSGQRVGTHNGLHHYTIGQRRGVGVSTGQRSYVIDIRPSEKTLVIGSLDELSADGLIARGCTWSGHPPQQTIEVLAQLRYRHKGVKASVIAKGDVATLSFVAPERAITPGQAVVFYDGERVMGGGWIDRQLGEPARSPFAIQHSVTES